MTAAIKSRYPRALPFQSPEEMVVEEVRLQRLEKELAGRAARLRLWAAGLGAAVVLALTLLAGIWYGGIRTPPAEQPSAAVLPKEPEPVRTPAVKPAVAVPHKDGYLEALGGMSAAHLYQTHLNIGLLADGVENEAYSREEATKTLRAVFEMVDVVDGQLAKLSKHALEPDERAALQRIKAVSALLHVQARALQTYWADGGAEQSQQFHQARQATWQGVSKVLGLEGE